MVSFAEASVAGGIIFGFGVLFGMLLYRLLWHVDTATIRADQEIGKMHNRALQDEIVRLQRSLDVLSDQFEIVRGELRDYKDRALVRLGAGADG